MANMKRNMIQLVKNPEEVEKGGEVKLDTYWTPMFLPFSKVRDAIGMQAELDKEGMAELDIMDRLADFVANDIYGAQFTKDDIYDRLHAPDGVEELQNQIMFVAQGDQSSATKKFLESKN
ncbi:phage tail assembly chaperone G [Salimicrobium album]|uniref:Phage tail assembly chaperone protein, TAC n=1 Tax=Salimicrobium album TaxID=50717 RepID=A0A1H3DHX0_9BACI|nr:hypothetical protein [Salimicrobium album]SDX65249.1 hypothetical protein SAMN04488081_0950 [Salimicrobium album]